MDNLCHTLAGAALGEAGPRQRTRFGSATLMIASNLPDLDVLVFGTSIPSIEFRRGWTHGILAQLLLPLGLALVMAGIARRRPGASGDPPTRMAWLLLLSYLGAVIHVLMDLLNNYGVRLLTPFDWRWFYGDTLFIVDPWMWVVLGSGVWLARRRKAPRLARAALVTAAVYVALMLTSARIARAAVVDAWTAAQGSPPVALMVGPVPVTPFRRTVVIDAGDRYATGVLTWPPIRVRLDPITVAKNVGDARVAAAMQAPNIRGFLTWSRFPYWTIEADPQETRVTVRDMRVGALRGFVASTAVGSR